MSKSNSCRLCVNDTEEYVKLFTESGYQNEVYEIAVNYFHPMFLDPEEENHCRCILCLNCWRYIDEFHNFRESVLKTQAKLQENRKDYITELIDIDEKPRINEISINCENIERIKKEESYIVSNDTDYDDISETSDDFDFIGGSINHQKENIPINVSVTEDDYLNSDSEIDINFEVNKKNNMDQHLHNTSLLPYMSSENTSGTNKIPTNEPNFQPALAEHKQKKAKQNRTSLNKETSGKKTTQESDDLIAKWLPLLECVECRQSYSTFTMLKEHFRENHRSKTFFVVCCDRKLSYRCNVEEHVSLHLDPNTFKCDRCGRSFSSRANFCSHRKIQCSRRLHTNRKRLSSKDMDEVIAKWKPKLECEICHYSFTSFTILKQHFRENHSSEKFYAVCCQRKFFYRHQMEEHVRLHLDPKAYTCPSCGKYFNRKSDLSTHVTSKCIGK